MTRKDYRTIAGAIAAARADNKHEPEDTYGVTIAENLADELKRDNPRFDRGRFYTACGFGPGLVAMLLEDAGEVA